MNKVAGAAIVAVLLSGCGSETTKPITLRLSDGNGDPVTNARLICHDDGGLLGQTDGRGLLTLQVPGQTTSEDGFMPDCKVAYFRTDNDQFGRHFWFARFVRGEQVSSRAHSVELVVDN